MQSASVSPASPYEGQKVFVYCEETGRKRKGVCIGSDGHSASVRRVTGEVVTVRLGAGMITPWTEWDGNNRRVSTRKKRKTVFGTSKQKKNKPPAYSKVPEFKGAVGDRVLARWQAKSRGIRWYSGRVANVNEDGTFDIDYDDGQDHEKGVNANHVLPFVEGDFKVDFWGEKKAMKASAEAMEGQFNDPHKYEDDEDDADVDVDEASLNESAHGLSSLRTYLPAPSSFVKVNGIRVSTDFWNPTILPAFARDMVKDHLTNNRWREEETSRMFYFHEQAADSEHRSFRVAFAALD